MGGIVGPILFTILIIVAGSLRPGYSHVSQIISELGSTGTSNAWIQNVNFVILGLLIVAFAVGLHLSISGGTGSKVGPALLVAFGVGGVLQGLIPCDTAGCSTFDLHGLVAVVSFILVVPGIFLTARRSGQDRHWTRYRSYTLGTGFLMVAALVLVFLAVPQGAPLHEWRGAAQRIAAAVILVWIEVMALKLLSVSSGRNVTQET